jgi:hypothetical protein
MIIDTDKDCTGSAPLLKSYGVTIVGRYYCADPTSYKLLGKDEAKYLAQNGFKIFTVFEDAKLLDFSAGATAAKNAITCARTVGQPNNTTIFFAVDNDYYMQNDLNGLQQYFKDVKQTIAGRFDVGVYAGGTVCKTIRDAGYARFTWLASASTGWAGTASFYGGDTPEWDLCQVPPLNMSYPEGWPGLSVDIDLNNPTRNKGDFGAFMAPTV